MWLEVAAWKLYIKALCIVCHRKPEFNPDHLVSKIGMVRGLDLVNVSFFNGPLDD